MGGGHRIRTGWGGASMSQNCLFPFPFSACLGPSSWHRGSDGNGSTWYFLSTFLSGSWCSLCTFPIVQKSLKWPSPGNPWWMNVWEKLLLFKYHLGNSRLVVVPVNPQHRAGQQPTFSGLPDSRPLRQLHIGEMEWPSASLLLATLSSPWTTEKLGPSFCLLFWGKRANQWALVMTGFAA